MLTLKDLGWDKHFEVLFKPYKKLGYQPARLIRDNKITYGALLHGGDELEVIMSGKVYHDASCDAELPAVGDWVALEVGSDEGEHVIRARLPRRTCFSRKASGRSTEEQVIAANVDTVIVVTDADVDFNLRRLERYFALIARSGAAPVVLLNKADLYSAKQNEEALQAIKELNPEAQVFLTSIEKPKSFRALKPFLKKGKTCTMIGSSGVGKSSIVNVIFGDDYQWTDDVNELTGKGRHTTTARELMVLMDGGILIDNPGIREVHLWTDEKTLRERFTDIEAIAQTCKYFDCKHGKDDGCEIRAAVQAGTLSKERYEGFLKLDEEIAELQANRKKRQMTIERRQRREMHHRAKQYAERRDPERYSDYRIKKR